MADATRNEVAIEIESMLIKAEAPLREKCFIHRVPPRLRKLNEDAYTPKVVSIGPFHHGIPCLKNTESQKQIFLKRFIERTNTTLDSLVSHVQEFESKVRDCYSENIKFTKNELVKIIVVDAGFILELLIWNALEDWNKGDILSLNSCLFAHVLEDLLLFENQLPFFILDELFKEFYPGRLFPLRLSLLELTFRMFGGFNLQKVVSQSVTITPFHFTDLLRTFYLQQESNSGGTRPERKKELLYSVTQLLEAGVELKANTQEGRCLLDLKLSGHVLEIPQLRVVDSTEMLFRNMVALEQCIYLEEPYITDYIIILDYLINKEKDVDLLVQNEIVKNWLGDNKDVAELANGLVKNIFHRDFNSNYHKICEDLNAFCANDWNNKKATLRRDYCKTPWQTAASVAAILILIFTLTQTVCSLYQVIHGD